MKNILTSFSLLFMGLVANAQLPKVSAGSIERIENFNSKFVTPRNIDVWLPQGYSSKKKYCVLYMHDGQMLYNSSTTWNKMAWDVDDVISKLLTEHKINDVIVVGIWNDGSTRHRDYFPQKPFETLTQAQRDSISAQLQKEGRSHGQFKPVSDNYLKFLVTELKPIVDKKYSVYKDPQHTFIAGSSMGGLISMYAICQYPQVFGGAACLSTHWPGTFLVKNNPIPQAFFMYLKAHLPSPKNHKIYFDYGNQTLDSLYPSLQKKVDAIMIAKGFTQKNWLTKFYPGENHSEKSWHKRLDVPIVFLLKK